MTSGAIWLCLSASNKSAKALLSILLKYYYIMFIIVFWLGCDRPLGLLFSRPTLLLSILTLLFLPSSSVSLSYFILAVPISECFGKHSCMSSPFSITILNDTFFREAKINRPCFERGFAYRDLILLPQPVIFRILKSILFFVNLISLYFFNFL